MVYIANARTSVKCQMEVIRLEDIWRQRLHVLGWSARARDIKVLFCLDISKKPSTLDLTFFIVYFG